MLKQKIEIDIDDYNTIYILSEAFKKLLHELNTGATVIDKDGNIIYINDFSIKTYSYLSDFTIGKNITDSFPKSKLLNLLKNPKNAERQSIELKAGKKSSVINRFPIMGTDGYPIGAFSTFKDIKYYQDIEMNIRKKLQEKGHVAKYTFQDIITKNSHMHELIKTANMYAKSDFPVLIQGESGTGKELFAQSIHNASSRQSGPFVALNCSALTESILESELFGYTDSSFTGAKKGGKNGLFQEAHNGTLFLDEIGDMPLPFQAKLLRVLQEKEVRPVGSEKVIPIDVRIVAATNKNLKNEVDSGNFRLDLWYRLNVLSFDIIPLRKRPEDIEEFSRYYIQKLGSQEYLNKLEILIEQMKGYSFPGNIRELENILERFALTVKSGTDSLQSCDDIKKFFSSYTLQLKNRTANGNKSQTVLGTDLDSHSVKDILAEIEKNEIIRLLVEYKGSRTLVAKHMNISLSTLRRKILKYKIN
ncbi:sigma 54-interacting transcriptional regulator [Lachnospiraceae bacterium NSJ-143]|nr:sigma 54-interacting transcriptional regulator [Lachnospiraceae bacterium NSJ-143]